MMKPLKTTRKESSICDLTRISVVTDALTVLNVGFFVSLSIGKIFKNN